jgi:hypothetical protein
VWYFADGYLPPKKSGAAVEAHEALMVLNANAEAAELLLDFYFEDREPITEVRVVIGGQRVKCIRLDHPDALGGIRLPVATQYAIRVRSNVAIVVQQGRIDTTQSNLSYYGSMGYFDV